MVWLAWRAPPGIFSPLRICALWCRRLAMARGAVRQADFWAYLTTQITDLASKVTASLKRKQLYRASASMYYLNTIDNLHSNK